MGWFVSICVIVGGIISVAAFVIEIMLKRFGAFRAARRAHEHRIAIRLIDAGWRPPEQNG